MFCKASLITVALALLATATPVTYKQGIRVPITKRSSLTRADGTFDYDQAAIQNVRTLKYVIIFTFLRVHFLTYVRIAASTVRT